MRVLPLMTPIPKAPSGGASTAPPHHHIHTLPTPTVSKKGISRFEKDFLWSLVFVLTLELWKPYANKAPLLSMFTVFGVFGGFGGGGGNLRINFIKTVRSTPCSATAGWTACDLGTLLRRLGLEFLHLQPGGTQPLWGWRGRGGDA